MLHTSFKTYSAYGLEWTKNASANGGAQDKVIRETPAGHVVLHCHHKRTGRSWGACAPSRLEKLLSKNRGLYEVITKFPHKVYFDIDGEGSCPDMLDQVKGKVNTLFPSADLAISGSCTEEKTSYHIVLSNYLVRDATELEALKCATKALGSPFDWKVYTKNRNMKCVNQSKVGKAVQKPINCKDSVQKHMITCFFDQKTVLPFPLDSKALLKAIEVEKKATGGLDLASLPTLNRSIEKPVSDVSMLDLMNMAPLDSSGTYAHAYTHYVCRFARHNSISFSNFWDWCKQKADTTSRMNKWKKQYAKAIEFPAVQPNRFCTMLSKFYPDIEMDYNFNQFRASLDLKADKKVRRHKLSLCKYNSKYLLGMLPMGHGKTHAVLDLCHFFETSLCSNLVETIHKTKDMMTMWGLHFHT